MTGSDCLLCGRVTGSPPAVPLSFCLFLVSRDASGRSCPSLSPLPFMLCGRFLILWDNCSYLILLSPFSSFSCAVSLFPAIAADAVLLSLSEDRVHGEWAEPGVGGDV